MRAEHSWQSDVLVGLTTVVGFADKVTKVALSHTD